MLIHKPDTIMTLIRSLAQSVAAGLLGGGIVYIVALLWFGVI